MFNFFCKFFLLALLLEFIFSQKALFQKKILQKNLLKQNEENKSQNFYFSPSLLSYFKTSEIIESTGNEDNFWTTLNLLFETEHKLGDWIFSSKGNLNFIPSLNNKGRDYESFSPPNILFNQLYLDIQQNNQKSIFFQYSLKVGLFSSFSSVKPFVSYYLPIAYRTPASTSLYSTYPLIFGNRDEDIVTGNYLPRFDLGLVNQFIFNFYNQQNLIQKFTFGFGIVNGEEGLDSNSAKTILANLQLEIFENQESLLFFSMHGRAGNIGSIPVKEKKHLYKISIYHNKNKKDLFTFGAETTLLLHGVFNMKQFTSGSLAEITGKDNLTNEQNLKNQFFYRAGFWSPSMVYNDGSYDDNFQIDSTTLYGGQFFIYFSLNDIFSFLQIESHFSYYDPNLLADNKDIYRSKFKILFRTIFKTSPSLKIIFATLYGYDPFYQNNEQFYERELREKHVNDSAVILDLDIYLGLLYRLN